MRKFERFDYFVVTQAPPILAWKIFSDCSLWPHFSQLYEDIRWTKGLPWQEGSRLSIRARAPIEITLDHVIICCVPGEKVAWIDHALGTALEQWVHFEPQPGGGTLVRTWAEFTEAVPLVAGRQMKDILVEFTREWYNNFARECNQAADPTLNAALKEPTPQDQAARHDSLA